VGGWVREVHTEIIYDGIIYEIIYEGNNRTGNSVYNIELERDI